MSEIERGRARGRGRGRGRKQNYGRFAVQVNVRTRADAIKLVAALLENTSMQRGVRLREADVLDKRDTLTFVLDNARDPAPDEAVLWQDGRGVVNENTLTRDDVAALAVEGLL